jgi:hypothetical protein
MDAGGSFIMAVRDAVMPGRIGAKAAVGGRGSCIAGRAPVGSGGPCARAGIATASERAAAAMTAAATRLNLFSRFRRVGYGSHPEDVTGP